MQTGIIDDDFQRIASSRVAVEDSGDISPQRLEKSGFSLWKNQCLRTCILASSHK
jgi:hypothetical protein